MSSIRDLAQKTKEFLWMSKQILLVIWQTRPAYLIFIVGSALVGAVIPTIQIYIGKLIIDELVVAIGMGEASSKLWTFVGLEVILAVLLEINGALLNYVWTLMRDELIEKMKTQALQKILELDFSYFEDSKFHDKISTIEREASWRPINIIRGLHGLFMSLVGMFSTLVLLLVFGGWVVVLMIGIMLPTLIVGMRYARYRYSLTDIRSPVAKKVGYLTQLITWIATREVKLLKSGDYIIKQYRLLADEFLQQTRDFMVKKGLFEGGVGLLGSGVYYGTYVWILRRAILGVFTLGDVTMYSAAFERVYRRLGRISGRITEVYENLLFVQDYYEFMSYKPTVVSPPNARVFRGVQARGEGIKFENVWFKYKEDEDWVLKGVSLHIPPDTNLAIVGENGAGKTTLVKLLLRFYDPQKGRIFVDGTDLREYDLDSLYKRVAVLHQDFVQYNLTVQENIGFGNLAKMDNQQAIQEASRKARADEFIKKLKNKYQQQLGTRFEGGVDLSIGQWQRLALARTFMRDGEILILDEPTASLDAKAEYEIFKRFIELVEGKIAILISHRFSTVRLADKIVVVDEGEIKEQGSHEELMLQGGTYAEMFNLQAEGYR